MLKSKLNTIFTTGLVGYLCLYVFFLFTNLHLMPLAWVDEIAGLEPAINFLQGKGYTSKLWPYSGVEKQFLAYLPLQGWLHILFQKFLNFSIYNVRFPYALFLISGSFVFYKALRIKNIASILCFVLLVFVINEKSIFETTRGIRVEPIAFLLLSLAFYGVFSKNKHCTAISLSLMLVLHPYLWPTALVLFLGINQRVRETDRFLDYFRPTWFWLYPSGLLIFYLYFIKFDVALFYSQFLAQAQYHQTFGGIFGRVYNHFFERFWPYYFTQPYVPFFIYGTLVASIYKIANRKAKTADIALVFTHLCWLIAIGPMHRYNGILFILSIFSIVPYLNSRKHIYEFPNTKILVSLILIVISFGDVVVRQSLAYMQRNERNPTAFLNWLDKEIPEGKTIISGHEIAYYQTAYHPNQDFFLFNTTPYRFKFEEYENLLLLSYKQLPKGHLLGTYQVNNKSKIKWLERINSLTYDNINLYKFESNKEYENQLQMLKQENTRKNNTTKYD